MPGPGRHRRPLRPRRPRARPPRPRPVRRRLPPDVPFLTGQRVLDCFFPVACGGTAIVPGGFGGRGIEGKIRAAAYARENKVPYFGICLGMQCASIEFARNVAGLKRANSTEFDEDTLVRIRSVCDALLALRRALLGEKYLMVLEVVKIRGAHKNRENVVSFEVVPGYGMKIIPISVAKV